ncbi:hypothetical protein [Paludibaculum fermentans]|uniref:Uncharacterized protein n=1 Tax=Paludibaculum fermentans TaxID=1473598 RepID=A0A7S7NQY5_PALFE|nr:hypothetical protein [Paludibaculum fermentans]QOY88187.1 hypothetical protein IRI77_36540 [Paludibaculum fermentans]
METTPVVFDAARPIALQLRTPTGLKTVRVRFPNDEEWIERQRKRKVIVKQLGRGVSETTIPNSEDADAALLTKIRVPEENAPEVDAFEASRVIEQLSQAEVDDVVQVGDAFRVTLRVLGGTVTHLLKMPSAKDVFEYRRGFARVLDLPYNRQELIINLAPAGALFKRLAQTAEGYAGEVPVIHQAVAVKAAIDALDAAFQETADPN